MLARCLRVTERQPASYFPRRSNQARPLRYASEASGSLGCMRPVIEGRSARAAPPNVEGVRRIKLVDPLRAHEYVAPPAFALDERR
jgi:hypothetical protein